MPELWPTIAITVSKQVLIFNNVKQNSQGCIVLVKLSLMTLAALSSKRSKFFSILKFCSFKQLCKSNAIFQSCGVSVFKGDNHFNGLVASILVKDLFPKSSKNIVLLPRHGGFLKNAKEHTALTQNNKQNKKIFFRVIESSSSLHSYRF